MDRSTTDNGAPIDAAHSSLRFGRRGPLLVEDRVLRETLFHFAHQRTADRVVHANGVLVHGWFECTEPLTDRTTAHLFTERGRRVPVAARFSSMGGRAGTADCVRDVRGFAVRFFTEEGNWDLVGSSIPVSFVQDALAYPDLVRARRSSDPAAYWNLLAHLPEALHATMWTMSSRGLPSSLRAMDGFGVHTYRFVAPGGRWSWVRFHWRAGQGIGALHDDEATSLAGIDPHHHRRDLRDAIAAGRPPSWELRAQVFDDDFAAVQTYDVLDPTVLIPEEDMPSRAVGLMVLDRLHGDHQPGARGAHRERADVCDDDRDDVRDDDRDVVFSPANLVPGIDVSDDPLLQARLGGYCDAQAARLGRADAHLLPINRPRRILRGQDAAPPQVWRAAAVIGVSDHLERVRQRPALFGDHVGQPRLFWMSQPPHEQTRIASSFATELATVSSSTRDAVLGQLRDVSHELFRDVRARLGLAPGSDLAWSHTEGDGVGGANTVERAPSLSVTAREHRSPAGRTVAVLADTRQPRNGFGDDDPLGVVELDHLCRSIDERGATAQVITPRRERPHGPTDDDGGSGSATTPLTAHSASGPDAVAIVLSTGAAAELCSDPDALRFVVDAFVHLKPIGYSLGALPLLRRAGIEFDEGVVTLQQLPDMVGRRIHGRQARLFGPSSTDE